MGKIALTVSELATVLRVHIVFHARIPGVVISAQVMGTLMGKIVLNVTQLGIVPPATIVPSVKILLLVFPVPLVALTAD